MDVKLVMFKSNGQRKEFPLISAKTVIGRGENCDLRVPLVSVSRHHCELIVGGGTIAVKDLGSSNGTFVNNHRVNEATLQAGDRLAVGPIVFTTQIDGVPDVIRPVKTRGQLMAEDGSPGTEEIIELEDDVIAQPGASALEGANVASSGDAADGDDDIVDLDPISALEALADDGDEDEDEKKD